jgi:protein O-GlcNAc transferase
MSEQVYREWLARGRKHHAEGRVADALPCYRRAAQEELSGTEARLHLGEALWQLGLRDDAIGAWRDAVRVGAAFLPARLTLADALLTRGDYAGAADVAAGTLALVPGHPRARVEADVAAVAGGNAARLPALCEQLAGEPALGEVPALAQALGAAPADALPPTQWSALTSALVARAGSLPRALLAVLAERGGLPADAVTLSDWRHDDAEALRRLACAWQRTDPAASARASLRYAEIMTAAAPVPPLSWPRRTRGEALRVGWLAAPDAGPEQILALRTAFAAVQADPVLASGEHTLLHAGEADALRAALGDTLPPTLRWLQLPVDIDTAVTTALAALDLDVLVDCAGMRAAFGPLLAARPARTLVACAATGIPSVPPLVDSVPSDGRALIALLRDRAATIPAATADMPSAQALHALWDAAVRAHQSGDEVAAMTGYRRVLATQPDYVPALRLQGALLRARGDPAAAAQSFAHALALSPDFAVVRVALAELLVADQRVEDAVSLLREGLARRPESLDLARALGHAELARGDGAAAAAAFGSVLARAPTDGEAHYNHGVALQMQGNAGEAARAYQRALQFRPDLAAADFNLGVMFTQQGRPDAAITAFSQALSKNPDHVEAWRNRGEALFAAGRYDAWVDNYRRFEQRCPKALPLAAHALEVCQHLGDFAGVDGYLDGLRNDRFQAASETELVDVFEVLLFLLLNFDVEPELLAWIGQMYDAAAARVYGPPLPLPAARRPGKLRVGYLSGDLRNHVMGKMMWQAIEHHDRTRFDLHFYSTSLVRDAWTDKFASVATRFVTIAGQGETAAAREIARDDLDLLVDLSTHTKWAMPGILARKPARVQITHVASCGNVGLSAVDFKLTDRYADVPENQAYMPERLLPMAGCVYPYRYIPPATLHPFHRANFGIAADTVVIGAFVSLLKLSRRCLALWRDVLLQIPRAKLAFSPNNAALRPYYTRVAEAAGIPADRFVFLPQGRDENENQARYAMVDFTLDTMPYGGVNGTLEALTAGVPVVTLKGRRHGERSGYSILANLGVLHTVAESGREFVEIAVRLANDRAFAVQVRAAIQAGLAASPLVDMKAHARALESAYVEALRQKAPDALAAAGFGDAS